MTSGYLGLAMLGLIVIAIMMGFPTAFTLMGLGMLFGYIAYFDPSQSMVANKVFDLMVQRTYGGMTNDTLLSIPLFVLMGYVIERAALVDQMFRAVQLSFRRLPASLAVATLIVCTFWGIASGIVGAVVVLMGVIAMRPMLSAGYDTRLAAGVITAGGTLGILIPPSVMIIVYAAVAGQSVVKLYAAAMVPGFFLAFLYFVYIVGWATINPKVAPKLPDHLNRMDVPDWLQKVSGIYGTNALVALLRAIVSPGRLRAAFPGGGAPGIGRLTGSIAIALGPLFVAVACFAGAWWYVVVHSAPDAEVETMQAIGAEPAPAAGGGSGLAEPPADGLQEPPKEGADAGGLQEPPSEGGAQTSTGGLQEPPGAGGVSDAAKGGVGEALNSVAADAPEPGTHVPENFHAWFWGLAAATLLGLALYYRDFDAENLEVQRLLFSSVMPLALLTGIVLVVILFGITTATESAAVGAAGAFLLALHSGKFSFAKLKESIYLTAKTTAMVCWLFVGSGLFSAVFALHGGQELIERWIMGMDLSPLQFLMLSQALIFILGWPLEWTEIIVIFVPIFLP
ncbi:MAG: TRAP transporter large permease subunit, partial [Burkholderiales bacterium]